MAPVTPLVLLTQPGVSTAPHTEDHSQHLESEVLADLFPIIPWILDIHSPPTLLNDPRGSLDIKTALRLEPFQKRQEPLSRITLDTTPRDDSRPHETNVSWEPLAMLTR